MELYWTGARASDTRYTGNLFKGSVTIYGNGKDGNLAYCSSSTKRINHNVDSPEASLFILKKQLELISQNENCMFMAYNPNYVYGSPQEILARSVCLNDETLMKRLDHKISFREIASTVVSMLECQIITGEGLKTDHHDVFDRTQKNPIVIQSPIATGGEGTFLVNSENIISILPALQNDCSYLVTDYVANNIPINAHCVIYDDSILILPPSTQMIVNKNNRLLYLGADYISYQTIDERVKKEFIIQLELIGEKLRILGYRGVIGFDAIIAKNKVFIIEANNRFQGSTYALNCALWNKGFPSVQQLNLEAFSLIEKSSKDKLASFAYVPYSYFIFSSDRDGNPAKMISKRAHLVPEVQEHSDDGYLSSQMEDDGAYLFHLLFSENISEIDRDMSSVKIHPSLLAPTLQWYGDILIRRDITKIKISLINQGVHLTNSAKEHLMWGAKIRTNEYFSLDIVFQNGIYVNCPTCIKFVDFSPFALDFDERMGLYLTYYDFHLAKVELSGKPVLKKKLASSGCELCNIAFFSTDRLRLQNSPTCVFNNSKSGCRFCEVYDWDLTFDVNDILETIDSCFELESSAFNHVLIGGRSHPVGQESETILKMCDAIKKHKQNIAIYLMCLPPKSMEDIHRYYEAGITEFGFNIEVFDRTIAQRLMPGKGEIPLQQYFDALKYAVSLCGKRGAVRSAFIVGLEPVESLLSGIEAVCQIGVSPILSAFRPIKGTPMQHCVPLTSSELFFITKEAETIAQKYEMQVGPNCVPCQNNTLNIINARVNA
jgi:hypothetical protein